MSGSALTAPHVRDVVARSWRRSAAQGASRTTGDRLPRVLDTETLDATRDANPVAGLMPVVRTLLDGGTKAAGAAFAAARAPP